MLVGEGSHRDLIKTDSYLIFPPFLTGSYQALLGQGQLLRKGRWLCNDIQLFPLSAYVCMYIFKLSLIGVNILFFFLRNEINTCGNLTMFDNDILFKHLDLILNKRETR